MRDAGVWLEITNLVIPGINDDMQMIREMCKWLKFNGLSEAPLHFSRFFPRYKMQDIPPTPRQTLYSAKQIAEEEGIKYVYLGNI
jgi:pyruvate formate lyase activating enzyme